MSTLYRANSSCSEHTSSSKTPGWLSATGGFAWPGDSTLVPAALKGCLSHQLGWLCCHQRFPGCAGQTHAAAGKLPATSSVQVSARGGSSLTLSQNLLLCQGCSLVHILGSMYQQGSWPAPWQLQQNRCQICNCSVYLAQEVAQPQHLCGAERHRAMHSRDRLNWQHKYWQLGHVQECRKNPGLEASTTHYKGKWLLVRLKKKVTSI